VLGTTHRRLLTRSAPGFTVIELLVVLAALALLLSIAAPRYMQHLDHAREVALREDLYQMRTAIDKFFGDQGRYPASLDELVGKRYLRSVPVDPITQRADTWVAVAPTSNLQAAQGGAMADVRSGAPGQAQDGSVYASW
jgi:general secretion pathway protein G